MRFSAQQRIFLFLLPAREMKSDDEMRQLDMTRVPVHISLCYCKVSKSVIVLDLINYRIMRGTGVVLEEETLLLIFSEKKIIPVGQ